MILGDELRLWLGDRARLDETRAAANRFACTWNRGEVHQRFETALTAVAEPTPEILTEAVRTLFADDGWIDRLVADLAAQARRDPFFEPPFRTVSSEIHSGLLVYDDDNVSIAVGTIPLARLAAKKSVRRAAVSINCTGQVSVLKFVKAGGAILSFWEAPPTGPDFASARAGTCRRTGERGIEDGDILVVDGRFESFAIDRAQSNVTLVQASIKCGQAPLSVEYDVASGRFVGCSAADDGDSRIQMITTLVRKLGRADAFPIVAGFLGHPSFFVRWHVMRELLGLDASAALPHLTAMAAGDSHPEVRRAAQAALGRFGESVSCPA